MTIADDHRAPNPEQLPGGLCTFDLPLGKVRVRIVDLPTPFEPFVAENYTPFAEPPDDGLTPDLTVTCTRGDGIFIPLPGPGEVPVIDVDDRGEGRFTIRSHWQDGEVDVRRGTGAITLTSFDPIQLRMSLENFLRVSCQMLLPDRGAFLMHSAGIVDRGRCFLFFGHSGAGKSTATALSEPRDVLSDDMVLVDAEADPVVIHAVPFFGAFPMRRRTRGAFPAAAALRLRQASDDRIEALGAARSVATVSASVPFVHELGLRHEGLTDLVTRFCEKVPVADLHFTRSDRFWSLLDARFPA